jgi:hypothetical protein
MSIPAQIQSWFTASPDRSLPRSRLVRPHRISGLLLHWDGKQRSDSVLAEVRRDGILTNTIDL